jgi:hypothetical protein
VPPFPTYYDVWAAHAGPFLMGDTLSKTWSIPPFSENQLHSNSCLTSHVLQSSIPPHANAQCSVHAQCTEHNAQCSFVKCVLQNISFFETIIRCWINVIRSVFGVYCKCAFCFMCVTIFMVLGNNLVAQDTFNCVIILLIIITLFSNWLSYNCCPHFKWLVGWLVGFI